MVKLSTAIMQVAISGFSNPNKIPKGSLRLVDILTVKYKRTGKKG
jgi:hypothetical protein